MGHVIVSQEEIDEMVNNGLVETDYGVITKKNPIDTGDEVISNSIEITCTYTNYADETKIKKTAEEGVIVGDNYAMDKRNKSFDIINRIRKRLNESWESYDIDPMDRLYLMREELLVGYGILEYLKDTENDTILSNSKNNIKRVQKKIKELLDALRDLNNINDNIEE